MVPTGRLTIVGSHAVSAPQRGRARGQLPEPLGLGGQVDPHPPVALEVDQAGSHQQPVDIMRRQLVALVHEAAVAERHVDIEPAVRAEDPATAQHAARHGACLSPPGPTRPSSDAAGPIGEPADPQPTPSSSR